MAYRSCGLLNNSALNINGRVDKAGNLITSCCENLPDVPGVPLGATPEETLERFIGMRMMVIADSIFHDRPYRFNCEKCANYMRDDWSISPFISYVNLSFYPSPCQCHCIYCSTYKWEDTPAVAAGYEHVFQMLELMKQRGIVSEGATWQISCGEITIHPYRKRILELVQQERAVFYTNAFLYDADIGDNLHRNPNSSINLSIDAGTPATWKAVKGVDNFDQVTSNLVEYYKRSARPGQITLKYIVLPGVNDNYEDYISLMEIMKVLKVPHLTVSRDTRFKYEKKTEAQTQLIGAAAWLVALCAKNKISVDMFTYSPEEIRQTERFANELLQGGQL